MSATTRNETIRSVIITGALAAACAAIGIYAIYLALQMVAIFGEGMGVDEASRKLYANAHVAVHIFGTISAILIGIFLAGGRKVLTTIAIIAMLLCGGYGILNMVGFTSTNRVSVAAAKKASNVADERQYLARRQDLKDRIKWLEGQSVQAETPREKNRMLREIDAKQKELNAIVPPKPTAATALTDAQAYTLGTLSGISPETLQLALPIPAAVLLYAAEVLSFIFFVQLSFLAVAHWRALATVTAPSKRSGNGGGGGGNRSSETLKSSTESKVSEVSVAMKGLPEPVTVPPKTNVVPIKMQQLPAMQLLPGKSREFTRAEAFDDLQAQLAQRGVIPSQATLARRWNKPQPTVSRWLSKWDRHVQRVKVGKINSLRRQRMGDGGSQHVIHA